MPIVSIITPHLLLSRWQCGLDLWRRHGQHRVRLKALKTADEELDEQYATDSVIDRTKIRFHDSTPGNQVVLILGGRGIVGLLPWANGLIAGVIERKCCPWSRRISASWSRQPGTLRRGTWNERMRGSRRLS